VHVQITSVSFSFAVSPHERLLFRHLTHPLEEDTVVVVALRVVVALVVVSSGICMEPGSSAETCKVVVGRALVSSDAVVVVVVPSLGAA
jgi:hypothetical protein